MTAHESSIADILAVARSAYAGLGELAEEVEDEWSYVSALQAAWLERFDEVAAGAGDAAVPEGASKAVAWISEEVARVTDPHRAIDWLSTFPQVVLVALGERP